MAATQGAQQAMSSTTKYFEETSPKADEIRRMLDTGSVKDKLEGMKRIVASVTRGEDVSDFFPDVVKLVIVPNLGLKKLVYMYLVHYSERQQDLALLSINSFNKDLSNPNQVIRASAMRVMSSIRVPVVVQILLHAIKKCMKDSSPYVRRAAAMAIPKVALLDPTQKESLIEAISSMLSDRSTLVLGAVIIAWNEVCPDDMHLLHAHFKKICRLLADLDEWSQVIVINVLMRYGRANFENPQITDLGLNSVSEKKKGFYSDAESEDGKLEQMNDMDLSIDADHRLLLQSSLPLLNSRNDAVVVAVAALYFYLAPPVETKAISKPLLRLLRSHRETQSIILDNIVTMSAIRPALFSVHVKDFYVRQEDPIYIRKLKVEILTNLANETNVTSVLKELMTYVKHNNKEFVSATVKAIGNIAFRIPDVADSCLHGVMQLLSSESSTVVTEALSVIKNLLQGHPSCRQTAVPSLARLLNDLKAPAARSSLIWILGEYEDIIHDYMPDILRVLARDFSNEESPAKLQILNLAVKVHLKNPSNVFVKQLLDYVLSLAKYDVSYDIRDKARLVRTVFVNMGESDVLRTRASDLFLAPKPLPVMLSALEKNPYTCGSLAHIVNQNTPGYIVLSDFASQLQNAEARNDKNEEPVPAMAQQQMQQTSKTTTGVVDEVENLDDFYAESEEQSEGEGSESSYSSYSESMSGSASGSESEQEETVLPPPKSVAAAPRPAPVESAKPKQSASKDLESLASPKIDITPVDLPTRNLLNPMSSGGLGIDVTFKKTLSLVSDKHSVIALQVSNNSADAMNDIIIEAPDFEDVSAHIDEIDVGCRFTVTLDIDLMGKTTPVKLKIRNGDDVTTVSLTPTPGELLVPRLVTVDEFKSSTAALGGMNEQTYSVDIEKPANMKEMCTYVINKMNRQTGVQYIGTLMNPDQSADVLFAAKLSGAEDVFVTASIVNKTVKLIVRSEQTMYAMQLVEFLRKIMK